MPVFYLLRSTNHNLCGNLKAIHFLTLGNHQSKSLVYQRTSISCKKLFRKTNYQKMRKGFSIPLRVFQWYDYIFFWFAFNQICYRESKVYPRQDWFRLIGFPLPLMKFYRMRCVNNISLWWNFPLEQTSQPKNWLT